MNITIIGTGLIGGSIAIGLRGFQTHIIGVDINKNHADQALKLGIVDGILSLDDALKVSDLIIVAIPVDATRILLPKIMDKINDNTVVTDMGSTKVGICEGIRNHPKRKNFVASHPIAGTENSGPTAAIKALFANKLSIVCEKELSADFALKTVEKMYHILNMKVIYMSSEVHDLHIAYVSHLSHIISFTLGLTVLEISKDEEKIFDMAGSGFASTVRLAKSSPEMWAPIFIQNSGNLSKALDIYITKLSEFKLAIENKNKPNLSKLMTDANDIRRILKPD